MIASALQCESNFLPWLRSALSNSAISAYQLDRLIARRGPHDLRILVSSDKQNRSPSCFHIEEATGDSSCFPLGAWQLAYRDPQHEQLLALDAALGDVGKNEIEKIFGNGVTESVLLSYAPARRAVIHYSLSDGTRAFGKLYRPGASSHAYELARQLSETSLADSFVTPIAHLEHLELIIWKEVKGDLLSDLFGTESYDPGLNATGKVLRKLHQQTVDQPATVVTLEDELAVAGKHISRLEGLFSEEDLDDLRHLQRGLEKPCASLTPPTERWIHGDFHDRQLIIRDGSPVILDLDGVNAGDPAIDIGNFLAHIDFRLAFELSDQSPRRHHDVFRQGYRVAEDDRRVQIAHAISLLRNAVLYLLIPERHRRLSEACRKIVDQF